MRVNFLAGVTLSLLLAAPVAAQQGAMEVTGRVLDGTTDLPIPDAVVRLADNGPLAVSDSEGRFVLRGVAPGTHPWQISRIGYATWNEDVAADAEDEFTIRLLPQPEVLEGLVVLADRFRDRRESSGMSTQVYGRTEIVRAAAGDLHTFLQTRLGVPLMGCGGEDREENCAVLHGRRVKIEVYIDEERATGGLSQLRSVSPADVYSVELFSGGLMVRVYTQDFIRQVARGRATLLALPYNGGVPLTGALDRPAEGPRPARP